MESLKLIARSIALATTVFVLFASNPALSAPGQGNGNGNGRDIASKNSNGTALGQVKRSSEDKTDQDVSLLEAEEEDADTGDQDEESGEEAQRVNIGPGKSGVNGRKPADNRFKNGGNGNASDGIKGRILTNKDIVYTGEPLEIGLHFAQGAQLIQNGTADAYLVIFAPQTENTEIPEQGDDATPDGEETTASQALEPNEEEPAADITGLSDAIVVPVSDDASTEIVKLFQIPAVDLAGIAAGTYQLGLILTIPGGDPLKINDWFNGLLGLVDIAGLTITAEAVNFDADGDGELDCDQAIDGLTCADQETSSAGDGVDADGPEPEVF